MPSTLIGRRTIDTSIILVCRAHKFYNKTNLRKTLAHLIRLNNFWNKFILSFKLSTQIFTVKN